MTRVLVCGGRDFADFDLVCRTLSEWAARASGQSPEEDIVIVHGGALGADTLAERWASENWLPTEIYHADWERHGKAAGPIRNQRMIDEGKPNLVVAFPGGRGTADMIRRAKAAGIETIQA